MAKQVNAELKESHRNFSYAVNRILKHNGFYRVGGKWLDDNTLHIGYQPKDRFHTISDLKQFEMLDNELIRLPEVRSIEITAYEVSYHRADGVIIKLAKK